MVVVFVDLFMVVEWCCLCLVFVCLMLCRGLWVLFAFVGLGLLLVFIMLLRFDAVD